MPIVDLTGEEPAQYAPGTVGVVDGGAHLELIDRDPLGLHDEGNGDPRRGEQRAEAQQQGSAGANEELTGTNQNPHRQSETGQVGGQEVKNDGKGEHEYRGEEGLTLRDEAPTEGPRQRKSPHGPQLGPETAADPDIALVSEATARHREEQGREGRGDGRLPAPPRE